jgi:hypothetical protein
MNYSIRRKLDMAGRVRDFCRTHPAEDNAGYTAAVARLEELVARAEALAQQQVSGRLTVSGAAVNTHELRREIRATIRLLAGLARAAAQEEPELEVMIERSSINASHQVFLTQARVAETNATTHRDLLTRYGMPQNFLEEFKAQLDSFEEAINDKHAGRAAHVGARADLFAVGNQFMRVVGQLDAINGYRFRKDAESLAAWKSARDVAWPAPPEKQPSTGETKQPAA